MVSYSAGVAHGLHETAGDATRRRETTMLRYSSAERELDRYFRIAVLVWSTVLLALTSSACSGDTEDAVFVTVEYSGPGTVDIGVLGLRHRIDSSDPVPQLAAWPVDALAALDSVAEAQTCERNGRTGVCLTLADEGLELTLQGLTQAEGRSEVSRLSGVAGDAARRCRLDAFDATKLRCTLNGGEALVLALDFEAVPADEVRRFSISTDSPLSAVEAAAEGQPPIRAAGTQTSAFGYARIGRTVRFRTDAGGDERFSRWLEDCVHRPGTFSTILRRDLACAASFVTSDDPCATDNGGCDANAVCDSSSGTVQCTCLPSFVGDGSTCTCQPETDAAFCGRYGAQCGILTDLDSCGDRRSVADCGACMAPAICGGTDVANVCGEPSVPPTSRRVIQLVAANDHVCALLADGAVRCWGEPDFGYLGYGVPMAVGTPAMLGDVDIGGTVVGLSAGTWNTCAVLQGGTVRCWGPEGGTLGRGSMGGAIGDDETPASAGDLAFDEPVSQIDVGFGHVCVVVSGGRVRCWGVDSVGQVTGLLGLAAGAGTLPAEDAPVVDMGGEVVQVSSGFNHNCALMRTGAVRCWGSNSSGQLGYGFSDTFGDRTPAQLGDVDLGGPAVQVVAARWHSCAVLATGSVRCWGQGEWLGYGSPEDIGDDEVPADVGDVDVGGPVASISALETMTCAVLTTGAVRCWGRGVLGYPGISEVGLDSTNTPASVGDIDVGGTVTQVVVGGEHICALLDNGAVRCWGTSRSNPFGLGYDGLTDIGDDETPASAGDVPIE